MRTHVLFVLLLLFPTPARADVGFLLSGGITLGRSQLAGRTFEIPRDPTAPVTDGGTVTSPLTTALEATFGLRVRSVYVAAWMMTGGGRAAHAPAVRTAEGVWSRTGGVDIAAGGGEEGVRIGLRPALRLWTGARGGFEVVDLDIQRVGLRSSDFQRSFVAIAGPAATLEWNGLAFVTWADALHLGTVRAGLRWQFDQ